MATEGLAAAAGAGLPHDSTGADPGGSAPSPSPASPVSSSAVKRWNIGAIKAIQHSEPGADDAAAITPPDSAQGPSTSASRAAVTALFAAKPTRLELVIYTMFLILLNVLLHREHNVPITWEMREAVEAATGFDAFEPGEAYNDDVQTVDQVWQRGLGPRVWAAIYPGCQCAEASGIPQCAVLDTLGSRGEVDGSKSGGGDAPFCTPGRRGANLLAELELVGGLALDPNAGDAHVAAAAAAEAALECARLLPSHCLPFCGAAGDAVAITGSQCDAQSYGEGIYAAVTHNNYLVGNMRLNARRVRTSSASSNNSRGGSDRSNAQCGKVTARAQPMFFAPAALVENASGDSEDDPDSGIVALGGLACRGAQFDRRDESANCHGGPTGHRWQYFSREYQGFSYHVGHQTDFRYTAGSYAVDLPRQYMPDNPDYAPFDVVGLNASQTLRLAIEAAASLGCAAATVVPFGDQCGDQGGGAGGPAGGCTLQLRCEELQRAVGYTPRCPNVVEEGAALDRSDWGGGEHDAEARAASFQPGGAHALRLLVDDFVTDASSMDSAAMIVGTLTTYNPALDLYAVSRLITEQLGSGLVATSTAYYALDLRLWVASGQWGNIWVSFLVSVLLMYFIATVFIDYYMVWKPTRSFVMYLLHDGSYRPRFWVMVELLNLSVFLYTVYLRTVFWANPTRAAVSSGFVSWDRSVNLEYLAFLQYVEVSTISVNILISFMKIFKYLTLNRRLYLPWRTIEKATPELLSFMVVFLAVVVSFTIMAHVVFGHHRTDYRRFDTTIRVTTLFMLGEWDSGSELETINSLIAPIFFYGYFILVTIILVNVVVAVMLDAFTGEVARVPEFSLVVRRWKDRVDAAFGDFSTRVDAETSRREMQRNRDKGALDANIYAGHGHMANLLATTRVWALRARVRAVMAIEALGHLIHRGKLAAIDAGVLRKKRESHVLALSRPAAMTVKDADASTGASSSAMDLSEADGFDRADHVAVPGVGSAEDAEMDRAVALVATGIQQQNELALAREAYRESLSHSGAGNPSAVSESGGEGDPLNGMWAADDSVSLMSGQDDSVIDGAAAEFRTRRRSASIG